MREPVNPRRRFLKMLGATAAAAAAPAPPRIGPEHYVTLGRTGVRVSPGFSPEVVV